MRYGAVGDGSTPDQSAFQAAHDALPAGGIVTVPTPPVQYLLTGTVSFNSNKSLVGLGLPKIQYTGSSHAFLVSGGGASNHQRFENFELFGTPSALSGIYFYYNSNGPHTVRNVFIHDFAGSNAACVRMKASWAYLFECNWFRDSSIGLFAEQGPGTPGVGTSVNEVVLLRNFITNCSNGFEILHGNQWRIMENLFAGTTSSQIAIRLAQNLSAVEPLTDVRIDGCEFEGAFDYCIRAGNNTTNNIRGLSISHCEFDVATASLGTHLITVENTVGLMLTSLGRVPNLTGTKKWYVIANTVSDIIIVDTGYNSAQVSVSPTNYTLLAKDRVNANEILGRNGVFASSGTWNAGHFNLGNYHLWVDSSGRLRIKSGAPSSDTDGAVVGTQT
jgi:hypothetical protein